MNKETIEKCRLIFFLSDEEGLCLSEREEIWKKEWLPKFEQSTEELEATLYAGEAETWD